MRIESFQFAPKRRLAALAGVAAILASGGAFASADLAASKESLFANPTIPAIVALSQRPARPALEPIVAFPPAPLFQTRGALAETVRAWASASFVGARAAERRAAREAVAGFYAARDYAPLWSDEAVWSAAARSVLPRLQAADEDGLDLRAYRLPSEDAPGADGELDLSEAVVAYARQASGARVDPQKLGKLIGMRPSAPETAAVLSAVSHAGAEAGDMLRNFNPPHPAYAALRTKLAELRAARSGGERMAELQGAPAAATTASDGSPRRGFADHAPATLAGVEAELVANMERWRWMPRELGATHIEVNIPDFELTLFRDGVPAYRSRVIVGKPSTPTPVFSNAMRFITVNPYWNVPPSILKNEMLARHGGDLTYLAQRGFDVSYRDGRPSVRQRPGARNALGQIKFIFPNEYSVYMHDTPSRGLFAQAKRAFSHGCMRVDQPFRLAEAVLGPASGWSEERVRQLIDGAERTIPLARPLPVHIGYFTAFVDDAGALQMRDDLYGYSAKVRAALGL